ncbi:hypothetical protein LCGC14_1648660 [marine sediment metagenome]|uniref:Helicase C-terminal domain-containing protein n=1 Tax=marine sediment metagenome TaxID=412755 RepID=A0A0F9HYC8_9ZZZZ
MPQKRKVRGKGYTRVIPPDPILRKLVLESEVLMLDETHHASSESWYTIAMYSGSIRRYGLSGTPLKAEEIADLRMVGATGEIVYEVAPAVLIDLGLAAKPKVVMVVSDKASGPALPCEVAYRTIKGRTRQIRKPLPYDAAYHQGVVENAHHNRAVIRATEWLVDHGRQTLILCRLKAHWRTLRDMLEAEGIEYMAVWGDTATEERDRAKELLNEGKINVCLATTIFDEGEDMPGIEAIVLAEGVKAQTNVLQRIGRGMRKKGGTNEVWVVDFCPTCHEKLSDHAADRVAAYASEGYEVCIVEEWPSMNDEAADLEGELLPFKEEDWARETA